MRTDASQPVGGGVNANEDAPSTDVERLVKATVCLVDGVISAQMR